jgi:hypothetical protein
MSRTDTHPPPRSPGNSDATPTQIPAESSAAGWTGGLAGPAIRARVDAVATSYRKKAKRTGEAAATPALPRKTRAGGKVDHDRSAPEAADAPSAAAAGAAAPSPPGGGNGRGAGRAGGRGNAGFKLVSPYQAAGDQPKAIGELVEGLGRGNEAQVLLGITGSGKTFTIANVIAEVDRPTLIIAHNKILAAQLYGEFKELFPDAAVHYFVS